MARLALTVNDIPAYGGSLPVTPQAVIAANGAQFVNDGSTMLNLANTTGAPINVTVKSVPDDSGRLGDTVVAVPANGFSVAGPFPPTDWNQGGGQLVNVDSAADGVNAIAFRFNKVTG